MFLFILIIVFILTLLGIQIYTKTIINNFNTSLIEEQGDTIKIYGAGGVLWDVSFLFYLYLYLFKYFKLSFIVSALTISLLFTLYGLLLDWIKFKQNTKYFFKILISLISIFMFCRFNNVIISLNKFIVFSILLTLLSEIFYFFKNKNNMVLNVNLFLFLSYSIIFYLKNNTPYFYLSIFWFIACFALYIKLYIKNNIIIKNDKTYKLSIHLGNSGIELLSCVLFFLGIEYLL